MLPLVLEAAIRSMLLVVAIWLGLRVLRVRNPNIEMAAWQLVLLASLLMPFLIGWAPVSLPSNTLPIPQFLLPDLATSPAAVVAPVAPLIEAQSVGWRAVATSIYLAVAALLMLRLAVGCALTWRLCRSAVPIRGRWTEGHDVRASAVVNVPVTFGSTILLPESYASWEMVKRRAVMAHEGAHVARGDFYVLFLASINRAIFWFNPLAWWLHGRLADLAEERSDVVAIRDIGNRPRYAEVLIDFSSKADQAASALSMARPRTVRRRVERILTETTLPRDMDWKAWSTTVACILPLVVVAVGAMAQGPSRNDEKDEKKITALDAETLIQRRKEQRRPRTEVQIDPAILDNYVGHYQLGSLAIFTVTRKGDHLFVQLTGQDALRIYPEGPQKFFYRRVPAQISFIAGTPGPAHGLILHQNGLEQRANRVDQTTAQKVEESFAKRVKDGAPQTGSEAALRRQIEAFAQGQPVYDEMVEELALLTRPQAAGIQRRFAGLGPLQSLSFRGIGDRGWDIFEARFENGISICRIAMRADGKISGLLFQWGP